MKHPNKTATEAWLDSLEFVYSFGNSVSPRGNLTKEVHGDYIFFNMNYPICHHEDRKLSYKFMAAEAYWITSGSMFVEDIIPYNKHIEQFSDDGYIFNGAYGPRFINQLDYVVNSLTNDDTTRQAVLTIWTPNPIKSKDYPCTLSLQFLIRDCKLHTIVTMRSNDLWLGRPYDMFNFTVMTLRVLTYLNSHYKESFGCLLDLGTLRLQSGSAHIYESNFEEVEKVINNPNGFELTSIVPPQAKTDWKFVVESLLACRDMGNTNGLWRIRP